MADRVSPCGPGMIVLYLFSNSLRNSPHFFGFVAGGAKSVVESHRFRGEFDGIKEN